MMSIPIEQRILRRYGARPAGQAGMAGKGGEPMQGEGYRPFVIDTMPRMAFRIFHYDRKGYLQRNSFYFHSVRGLTLREGKHGVLLSFHADHRVVTLRGGMSMHEVAEAIEECRLETVTVFHPQVWGNVADGIEPIDRIAIDTLPLPGQERRQRYDEADFADEDGAAGSSGP